MSKIKSIQNENYKMMASAYTSLFPIPPDAIGRLVARPNRYLGIVDQTWPVAGRQLLTHIHDPGRLTELLYPGNSVLLRYIQRAGRKTEWDVIAAKFANRWVLVHSGYHRQLARQILENPAISPLGAAVKIEAEVTIGHSRLDYRITLPHEKIVWLEVKGCTLAQRGIALFPDAPTKRGAKHLETLLTLHAQGAAAALIILVFRTDATCFAANAHTDPEFATLFRQAYARGVRIYPLVLGYENPIMYYRQLIPVCT